MRSSTTTAWLACLVRHGWLGGDEVADPREVGRAIAAMLNEAARR